MYFSDASEQHLIRGENEGDFLMCIHTYLLMFFIKDNFCRSLPSFKEKALRKKWPAWYSEHPLSIISFSPIYDLSDYTFFKAEIQIPVFSDTKWFQQAAGCRKATLWRIASSDKATLCCYFAREIGRTMRSRRDKQNFATVSSFPFVAMIAGRMQASDSPGSVVWYGQRGSERFWLIRQEPKC